MYDIYTVTQQARMVKTNDQVNNVNVWGNQR